MPGENRNYLVQSTTGEKYIVKIISGDDSAAMIEVENGILEYALSGGFKVRLPQIIRNLHANIFTRIKVRSKCIYNAQLIAYLDGDLLDDLPDISRKMHFSLGKMMAEFNQAMLGYDHPILHRTHMWDVANASQHKDGVPLIQNEETRKLVEWSFEQWETKAKPLLAELPHQVIHGDGNGENILVTGEEITGLIDFTDCCYNPTVCELSTCLAYAMMDQADPNDVRTQVFRGYESVRALSEPERKVLHPLICGRLAMTICVAAKRRQLEPDHPTWFVSETSAIHLLGQLQ